MSQFIRVTPTGRSTLAVAILAIFGVSPVSASPMQVDAQLRIAFQGLVPVTLSGSGTIDVTSGIYSIPAGLLSEPGPIAVPVTTTTSIDSLQAVGLSNLAASLYAGGATAQAPGEVCAPSAGEACVDGGGVGGAMGINGLINVIIVPPNIVVFPFDLGALQLGLGGSGGIPFTYDAAVWTTGTARINNGTSIVSTQGSTTPNGGLSLVTASFTTACGNLFPILARFTLTPVVPEPSTLALLTLGVGGIVVLFRRG